MFGDCLRMLKKVLYAEKTGQPFLIAGSGTMGWDATAANVVEAGEDVVSRVGLCVVVSLCRVLSLVYLHASRLEHTRAHSEHTIIHTKTPTCMRHTNPHPNDRPPNSAFG